MNPSEAMADPTTTKPCVPHFFTITLPATPDIEIWTDINLGKPEMAFPSAFYGNLPNCLMEFCSKGKKDGAIHNHD